MSEEFRWKLLLTFSGSKSKRSNHHDIGIKHIFCVAGTARCLSLAGCLFGFTLVRMVGELLPAYTASHRCEDLKSSSAMRTRLPPLSVSDVDGYIIVRKLLDSIFAIFPLFIRRWEFQRIYTGIFFRKVVYTGYDASCFVQRMD